jgi:hypothetical protein
MSRSNEKEDTMSVQWAEYNVEIRIRDRIIGGIPVIPEGEDRADAYEKWARGQGVEEQDPSYPEPLHEALADDPEMPVTTEEVEGLETGFRKSDELGVYIEARQVKAMIRESAQRLGLIKDMRGMRQVIQHDLIVRAPDGSQKLPLGIAEPSGKDSRPISVVTRQGPRTAIKRFEYATQPTIRFVVRVLRGGVAKDLFGGEQLATVLEFGSELGLGADRSQGEGTFDVVSIEEGTP